MLVNTNKLKRNKPTSWVCKKKANNDQISKQNNKKKRGRQRDSETARKQKEKEVSVHHSLEIRLSPFFSLLSLKAK